MNTPRSLVLAALVIIGATFPSVRGWFLADDYYLGEQIWVHAAEHPGLWNQVSAAFAHNWTPKFQVFRPLTILTVQLDYALYGSAGDLHHITNMIFWVLAAAFFGAVVLEITGERSPGARLKATLLFGLYPAGVESLGWLVAREDLIMTTFGLFAVWLFLRAPSRRFAWSLALVPAFLAKETAVVLPLLILWIDLVWVTGWPVSGKSARRALSRHAPSLTLLGLYFGVRWMLFDGIGTTYNEKPYSFYLTGEGAPLRIGTSILLSVARLFTPINQSIWEAKTSLPLLLPWLLFLLPLLGIVFFGLRQSRPGDLRVGLIALAWVLGPLLLLCPLFHVEPTMEESRMLVLPMAGFLLPVAVSLLRLRRGALGTVLLTVLLATGFATFHVNLEAYEHAGRRARRAVSDLTDNFPNGSRVILFGADQKEGARGIHTSLSITQGAYVLSAGLFSATRAPFVHPPGLHADCLLHGNESALARSVDLSGDGERPGIAHLDLSDVEPRFRPLAWPGFVGDPPKLHPAHGWHSPKDWEPVFQASGNLTGSVPRALILRVHVPDGHGAWAKFSLPDPAVVIDPTRFEISIPGARLGLADGHKDLGHPLTAEVLRLMTFRTLWWWIEFRDAEDVVILRSPYAVINLAP